MPHTHRLPVLLLGLLVVNLQACSPDRPAGPLSAPPTAPPPLPASRTATTASALPVTPTAAASAAPAERRMIVHIVPLGEVPDETLAQTRRGLEEHAPVKAVVEDARTPPDRAKSPRKGAWQASVLLDWLDGLPIAKGGKVMAVTESEIVTRKGGVPIWGILGMGSLDGRCSVISTYRMRRRWENGGAPENLVRERLWKIAIHELGHTLGLDHCPNETCIMEDGHGTVKTVDRDTALCDDCSRRFREALRENTE